MRIETPTRRCAPTSPFQGEVTQAARAVQVAKLNTCNELPYLPLQGGGRFAQQTGWGSP